jgi:hypothetical protein
MGTDPLHRAQPKDGLSQSERPFPALGDGYFRVDERTLEQMLVMAREYAGMMKFINLENGQEGTWDALFRGSEILVMASMLSIDVAMIEKRFHGKFPDPGLAAAAALADQYGPIAMLKKLHDWLGDLELAQSGAGVELRGLMKALLAGLREDVKTLGELRPWGFSGAFLSHFYAGSAMPEPAGWGSCHAALIQAIEILQGRARILLPSALGTQSNEPALSLQIVFVRLYQRVQGRLNAFTRNRLAFYYRDVLQAARGSGGFRALGRAGGCPGERGPDSGRDGILGGRRRAR